MLLEINFIDLNVGFDEIILSLARLLHKLAGKGEGGQHVPPPAYSYWLYDVKSPPPNKTKFTLMKKEYTHFLCM